MQRTPRKVLRDPDVFFGIKPVLYVLSVTFF